MVEILGELEGAVIYQDDVLVHGATPEEHDTRLAKVLETIRQVGLKLNKEKCKFRQPCVNFLEVAATK